VNSQANLLLLVPSNISHTVPFERTNIAGCCRLAPSCYLNSGVLVSLLCHCDKPASKCALRYCVASAKCAQGRRAGRGSDTVRPPKGSFQLNLESTLSQSVSQSGFTSVVAQTGIRLTLIMDEFGLPVLSLRTLTHSNQRISEELRGVVRGHAGGQQFIRTAE
jgi:hypothetical protein